MRQDQYEKLLDLSEKIADVVTLDIDPVNWTGHGTASKDLTQHERGDAYWCRKQAAASLALLVRVHTLVGVIQRDGGFGVTAPKGAGDPTIGDEPLVDELGREIADAEREAARLLDRAAREGQRAQLVEKTVASKK